MSDIVTPLVVGLLSASYILPPSSNPASFVLVFLLIFFPSFSFRLLFLIVARVLTDKSVEVNRVEAMQLTQNKH